MIDVNSFKKNWGIIDHSLDVSSWSWDRISILTKSLKEVNPNFYKEFEDGGFTLGGLYTDAYCKKILDFLQPLCPTYYARASLYAGAQINSKTFPLHIDHGQHLWIWQIIGDTPWQVENSKFILKKNQLLYILPGLKHCANPNLPRASITFSLDEFDD
jgi:hypothetical protein